MNAMLLGAWGAAVYAALRTMFYLELLVYLSTKLEFLPVFTDTRPARLFCSAATALAAGIAFALATPIMKLLVAGGMLGAAGAALLAVACVHVVEWLFFLLYLWRFAPPLVSLEFWRRHGRQLQESLSARKAELRLRIAHALRRLLKL